MDNFIIESIDGKVPEDFFSDFIEKISKLYKKNNMLRSEVFQVIDNERNYQEECFKNNPSRYDISDVEKPISEWLKYMEYHMQVAKLAVASNNDIYNSQNEAVLGEIRRIAALAVKCMEIYGSTDRANDKSESTGCKGNCTCKK